jgi:hypothetical protein
MCALSKNKISYTRHSLTFLKLSFLWYNQETVCLMVVDLASKFAKGIRDHQAHGLEAQNSLSSSPSTTIKQTVRVRV